MLEKDCAVTSFWETWFSGQLLSFLNKQNSLETPPFNNSALFLPAPLHSMIGESVNFRLVKRHNSMGLVVESTPQRN